MDHSIAAKYAARPAARFVRPSTRDKERRLGLRPSSPFQAPGTRTTALRGPEVSPRARLRASWRAIQPAVVRRTPSGLPRPSVTMEWARSGHPGMVRRPGATSAPWRG